MDSLRIVAEVCEDGEVVRSFSLDFQKVPGSVEHQPVVEIVDKKAGLEDSFELPPGNYGNLERAFRKLVAEADSQKVQRALQKINAFLVLWR